MSEDLEPTSGIFTRTDEKRVKPVQNVDVSQTLEELLSEMPTNDYLIGYGGPNDVGEVPPYPEGDADAA